MAASFKASTDIASRRSAVVIETQAVLRENPSDVAEAEARVFEGLIVSIIDHSEDWIEVKLPDGTTGWIRANAVEEV